eukprot:CAMPEP_0196571484 /NCGR_PEP_ID=MMETSP1081-20130531/1651_1 /TAXON_ID=36882 /ORGANISM="Pyramimonas amylifera, Strain CCMP720" /LENGTH=496 /DNA_ID=CAMNT_0041888451 /DNA_START=67 /DNA_END=1557 /DNA_ORIENTATION=+
MAICRGLTHSARQLQARVPLQVRSLLGSQTSNAAVNTREFSKGSSDNEAEFKKNLEDLSKETEKLKDRALGGLGALRDVAARAGQVAGAMGEHAKKAAETTSKATSKATEGIKSTFSEAAESDFVKQAARAASETSDQFKKTAAETSEQFKKTAASQRSSWSDSSKQFFKSQETDGKEGETSSSSSARDPGGLVERAKSALKYVKDAYKEEIRLARMTETEVEEESARQRGEVAAARVREAEREAAERGEDWKPSEETAVMLQKHTQTTWERRFKWFKEHPAGSSFFNKYEKFKSSPLMSKGRDMVGDMRERWETSDSKLVHRLQDMHSSMTAESEAAQAMTEIRKRDPTFDTIRFSRRMKEAIPVILKAYLKGDMEALKAQPIGSEMLERMGGQIAAWKAEGTFVDHTILDTSDVELVEMKMYGENPIVILRCACQQINCVRDKFENILEGAPDDIQSVHYGWAMEQNPIGSGVDGGPPGWTVREMMVQGMQAIV